MTNCQATVAIATRSEDSSDSWTENENASNNNSTEASTSSVESCEEPSSTVPKKKKTTKKLQFQEELSERILHLAEKEDDQVDLELSAIGQRMKHKLNNDEIDDLLDEIKDCTRKFFDNKRRRAEIVTVTVQPQMLTAPNEVVSVPPPPLQRHPHISTDNGPEGPGDMLIECAIQPSYNNMEYVTDPGGQTYMKLK